MKLLKSFSISFLFLFSFVLVTPAFAVDSPSLTADLDKSSYNTGDSMTLTSLFSMGVGLKSASNILVTGTIVGSGNSPTTIKDFSGPSRLYGLTDNPRYPTFGSSFSGYTLFKAPSVAGNYIIRINTTFDYLPAKLIIKNTNGIGYLYDMNNNIYQATNLPVFMFGHNYDQALLISTDNLGKVLTIKGKTGGETFYSLGGNATFNGVAFTDIVAETRTLSMDVPFTVTNSSTPPTVTTNSGPTDDTNKSGTFGGTVTDEGSSAVTARGIVWGTTGYPTITTNTGKTTDGTGLGDFSSFMSISSNFVQDYHVRAYATNSAGTSYGVEIKFTPVVKSLTVSDITSTSAKLGATVNSFGVTSPITAPSISSRGTCYYLTFNSTTVMTGLNPDTLYVAANCLAEGGTSLGAFSDLRTGLTPNTSYNYFAFAINALGYAYTIQGTFTTLAPAVPSGTLSATNCTILKDASTCTSKVTWTTSNLIADKATAVTRDNPANTSVSTLTSGKDVSNTIKHGDSTFYLYHNEVELKNAPVTATCVTGTNWDGSKCATINAPSGTLSATNCTILKDASTCTSKVTWTTSNLIAGKATAVTRDNPANTSVSTATSGTDVSNTIKHGDSTFYLYHNEVEPPLAKKLVTASCDAIKNLTWDSVFKKCVSLGSWSYPTSCPTACGTAQSTQTQTCTGGNGSCSGIASSRTCNATVACPPDTISVSLSATPTGPLTAPGATNLSWTTTGDPTSCDASGVEWEGTNIKNGDTVTKRSGMPTHTYVFGIKCHKTGVADASDTVTVVVNAPTPTGTLSATPNPCIIALGESTCTTKLTLDITNPVANAETNITKSVPAVNTIVATGITPREKQNIVVTYPSTTFYLNHNTKTLTVDGLKVEANCIDGTTWNTGSNTCVSTTTPTGTLSATDCKITTAGTSTCVSKLTWTTSNLIPGKATAVTKDNPAANTLVSTATSGTKVSNTINYGLTKFYLYHNSVQLVPLLPNGAEVSVTASCDATKNLVWDTFSNTCVLIPTYECLDSNLSVKYKNIEIPNPQINKIPYNSKVNVNWSSTGSCSCLCSYSDAINPSTSCGSEPSGGLLSGPLKRDTTYTVSCTGITPKFQTVLVDKFKPGYTEQ